MISDNHRRGPKDGNAAAAEVYPYHIKSRYMLKPKSDDLSSDKTLAALRRAAKNALKLAKQTGTPYYVMKDGRIVDIAGAKSRRKRASN